jgi:hypothetical protein
MNLVFGIVLLLVGSGMLVIARPNAGGQYVIPLMDVWAIGQLYVIATLLAFVLGVSFCLMAWPA